MRVAAILVLSFAASAPVLAQGVPFHVHALMEVQRISDVQLSPDGSTVAFVVQTVDLEKNAKPQQIFTAPVTGGSPKRITWAGEANSRPRWSPDSRQIVFVSDRGGSSQLWVMAADGSSPRQVTDLATEAAGALWPPDGENLLFTSEVYPDCVDLACNERRLEAEKNRKPQARQYSSLLFRHWDHWRSDRVTHLMVIPAAGGEVRDLTPGPLDAPPFSLSGFEDYAISPDGKEVCFVMKPDANPAVNTNSDLYVVPVKGGEPVRLTNTPGADNAPLYSPDGNYIGFLSQMRGGYESDKWRLATMRRKPIEYEDGRAGTQPPPPPPAAGPAEGGQAEEDERPRWEWDLESVSYLTDGLDRPVSEFTWFSDSKRLFFTTDDRGRSAIQMMSVNGGSVRGVVTGSTTAGSMQFTPDGRTMIYTEQSGAKPVEIYAASASGGAPNALTNLNSSLLERYQLTQFEEFRVEGAGQTPVHSFMLKPPGFDESKRYPVVFLIHGGPQGAWHESWNYRWNAQVFAGAGYVVVMPNPRGSTGYGQKFTDEITASYGGAAFEDVMAVVDHVTALPFVNPSKLAAAGGSYGGYMVNWMMGHTQRFQAFISHAGLFDMRSWALSTEELWFPIWDQQGMPWENPKVYERWSPSNFISDFFTPTLVIHGEKDFRVPYTQGLQLFTALRMQEVPSELLVFPDEGHWILKPANSVIWYEAATNWLARWLKQGAEQGLRP
jgi:dipeptidyl aminopeptidase/acylaminoacyl peptidase